MDGNERAEFLKKPYKFCVILLKWEKKYDPETQKMKVKSIKRKLEEWTGAFPSEESAQAWYDKHGSFHEKRGHRLAFMQRGKEVTVDWMNH